MQQSCSGSMQLLKATVCGRQGVTVPLAPFSGSVYSGLTKMQTKKLKSIPKKDAC